MSVHDAPTLRACLGELRKGRSLSREVMAAAVGEIMAGHCDPAQIGAFVMGLAAKGETSEEIVGAAMAMRAAVTPVRSVHRELLDTCGTGGSGIPRRNVSTAVALVVAACGVPVAQHGNRAATSRSGSADVLEFSHSGVDATPQVVTRCIDDDRGLELPKDGVRQPGADHRCRQARGDRDVGRPGECARFHTLAQQPLEFFVRRVAHRGVQALKFVLGTWMYRRRGEPGQPGVLYEKRDPPFDIRLEPSPEIRVFRGRSGNERSLATRDLFGQQPAVQVELVIEILIDTALCDPEPTHHRAQRCIVEAAFAELDDRFLDDPLALGVR